MVSVVGPSFSSSNFSPPISSEEFVHALIHKDAKVVREYVNSGGDVNFSLKDWDSNTPLIWVLARWETQDIKDTGIAEFLIKKGANVNAIYSHINSLGETALHFAVARGLTSLIPVLIEAGADVNAKDGYGETPLYRACEIWGGEEAAKLLIKKGANVNAINPFQETALHFAVARGLTSLIPVLIEAGADVNAKDSSGRTPLYRACEILKEETVKLLLAEGANPNIPYDPLGIDAPHINSKDNSESLEEERRLCYVGMTRAKRHLYLTSSTYRYMWGAARLMRPSRFLKEIPAEHLHNFSRSDLHRGDEEEETFHSEGFAPGDAVLHKEFGRGIVQKAYQGSFGLTYEVYFSEAHTTRTLAAKYAKLQPWVE